MNTTQPMTSCSNKPALALAVALILGLLGAKHAQADTKVSFQTPNAVSQYCQSKLVGTGGYTKVFCKYKLNSEPNCSIPYQTIAIDGVGQVATSGDYVDIEVAYWGAPNLCAPSYSADSCPFLWVTIDLECDEPCQDNDGDGYGINCSKGNDCNDSKSSVHPNASEKCNGIDDDCDGQVDEGKLNACGQCGSTPKEVCNGIDDDCDGQVDEGMLNACGTCGPAPDYDGDGEPNCLDNCQNTPNSNQKDMDNDGLGDACDADKDGDGVTNSQDNCPDKINNQQDSDGDQIGNACDSDMDGDGFPNNQDCKPTVSWIFPGALETCNGQDNNCNGVVDDMDYYNARLIAICENDPNASICESLPKGNVSLTVEELFSYAQASNCTTVYRDNDGDGFGAIEFCGCVGSGVLNKNGQSIATVEANGDCNDKNSAIHPDAAEVCNQVDDNCDGTVPAWDVDTDGDTHCDPSDNCPEDYNYFQKDYEKDGVGDACDSCPLRVNTGEDTDTDGVDNACDNCVTVVNPFQLNHDDDKWGDVCDSDDDNDGVADTVDNCPIGVNGGQDDSDNDGVGDQCDNCPYAANPDQDAQDADNCDELDATQQDGPIGGTPGSEIPMNEPELETDPGGDPNWGDANGDGLVNVVDVLCINKTILEADSDELPVCLSSMEAADVNCDGAVNVVDTQLTIQKSLACLSGNCLAPLCPALDDNADGIVDACQTL